MYRQNNISSSVAHTAIKMSLRPKRLKYSSAGDSVSITPAHTAPLSPIRSRSR